MKVNYTVFSFIHRDYRVAVNFHDLELAPKISNEQIKDWLDLYNYFCRPFDIAKDALACCGLLHRYQRGAKPDNAPVVTDNAGFIKCMFATNGLDFPGNPNGQWDQMSEWCENAGLAVKGIDAITRGDVVFAGRPATQNGGNHEIELVGIATEGGQIVHCQDVSEPYGISAVPIVDSYYEARFLGAFEVPQAKNLTVVSHREDFSDSTWIREVVQFALTNASFYGVA